MSFISASLIITLVVSAFYMYIGLLEHLPHPFLGLLTNVSYFEEILIVCMWYK